MFISYSEERREFILTRNRDDYLDWITVPETSIPADQQEIIKNADEALECSISIDLF